MLTRMHEDFDERSPAVQNVGDERKVSPTLIGLAVVAVAAIIFIAQNGARQEIKFLFISVTTRLWLALIITLLLGVLLDRLLVSWWRRRNRE